MNSFFLFSFLHTKNNGKPNKNIKHIETKKQNVIIITLPTRKLSTQIAQNLKLSSQKMNEANQNQN